MWGGMSLKSDSEKENLGFHKYSIWIFVLWLRIIDLLKMNFYRAAATDPLLELGNFSPARK